ncbi:hypothetical protein HU200_014392 [Digitaria exilis]|uniref:F-box domain-containing protein n=1 Tax=Digitaria exilis TaxID=1010633 RepID=A0A835FC27_9POAL|nr:hypothetical protein HU200_014392 [Digitaria exilis]
MGRTYGSFVLIKTPSTFSCNESQGSSHDTFLLDLPDDILELILLSLHSPLWLVRAASTCKRWRPIIYTAGFTRRFHAIHGRRPIIAGSYYNDYNNDCYFQPRFEPSPFAAAIHGNDGCIHACMFTSSVSSSWRQTSIDVPPKTHDIGFAIDRRYWYDGEKRVVVALDQSILKFSSFVLPDDEYSECRKMSCVTVGHDGEPRILDSGRGPWHLREPSAGRVHVSGSLSLGTLQTVHHELTEEMLQLGVGESSRRQQPK